MKKVTFILIFFLFAIFSCSQDNNKVDDGTLIIFENYSITFNKSNRQASYATYTLTRNMLEQNVTRKDKYYYDAIDSINPYTAKDYKGSGFDRGHLVPAADMMFSDNAMKEVFNYVNIVHQYPSLNRGIWRVLESNIRGYSEKYDTIQIVTGPIVKENKIPNSFFKVILLKDNNNYKAVGFLIPNLDNKNKYNHLIDYAVTIDYVEDVTGFDFFYELDDKIEKEVERDVEINFWFK